VRRILSWPDFFFSALQEDIAIFLRVRMVDMECSKDVMFPVRRIKRRIFLILALMPLHFRKRRSHKSIVPRAIVLGSPKNRELPFSASGISCLRVCVRNHQCERWSRCWRPREWILEVGIQSRKTINKSCTEEHAFTGVNSKSAWRAARLQSSCTGVHSRTRHRSEIALTMHYADHRSDGD
jgi:hypothetical protein